MAKDANKKPKSRDKDDAEALEDETSAPTDDAEEDGDEDEEDGDDEDEDEDDASDEEDGEEDEEDEEEDEEDESEEEEEDEDEDEGDEDEAPAKAAAPGKEPVRARPLPRRRRKRGNPTRNIILFVVLVGGLALAFAALGNSRSGPGGTAGTPKWKVGQVVDAEITLVTTDHNNLACAMPTDVNGRHCAFSERNKASGKPSDPRQADKLLQPYTTVDRVQFMASGLWMQPELKAKLDKENFDRPSPRFSVKCKFHVEGKSKNAFVQWKNGEGWHPANDWYTGWVDNCRISK